MYYFLIVFVEELSVDRLCLCAHTRARIDRQAVFVYIHIHTRTHRQTGRLTNASGRIDDLQTDTTDRHYTQTSRAPEMVGESGSGTASNSHRV